MGKNSFFLFVKFKKQVLHVVDVLTFVDHDLVIVGAQLFGRLGAGVCMGFVIVVFDQQLQCQM